jgi:hypothetical protein
MIFASTITTNLVPYLNVFLDVMNRKWYRKQKRSNNFFEIERKYAQMLQTVFIVCTFGYGLPFIFISLMLCVNLLCLVDRALITYWFKPLPL